MNGNLKPFEPGYIELEPRKDFVAKQVARGFSRRQAIKAYRDLERDEIWINDEYQVNIDKSPQHAFPHMIIWHVSIKRRDKAPLHDWRDLQMIKNLLCGPEVEAVELYPAESRLVDTANQYHLWAFISDSRGKPVRLPFGWNERAVSEAELDGSKQRRFKE